MKTTIKVTLKSIKDSKHAIFCNNMRSTHCPVALAFKQANVKILSVTKYFVRVDGGRTFVFSDKVTRIIQDFDNTQEIKPFQFTINIPQKYFKK